MVRKIKKKYPNANFIHGEESLKAVVTLVNSADKIRDRKEAPVPERALYSYSRFGDQQKDDSNSCKSDDTDLSADYQSCYSSHRSHSTSRGRGNGKGKATKSSPGSDQSRKEHESTGACPHCVKFKFKGFHLLYKTASKCAYNPAYTRYRHENASLLLGTMHKAKCYFSPAKGGYKYSVKGPGNMKSSPTEPVKEDGSLSSNSVNLGEASEL